MSKVLAFTLPKRQEIPVHELFIRATRAAETDPDLALSLFRDLLHEEDRCPEAWINLGALEFSYNRNIPTATFCFRRALAIREALPMAHFNLALCLMKQDPPNPEEAIRHYERATSLSPGYFRAHFNLAGVYAKRNKFRKAITHYNYFLAYAPKHNANSAKALAAIARLSRQVAQKSRLSIVYRNAVH